VDLFRAEENACLLGTDALRDGVDVPGRSLRLVVFDKVPWPKPTILHKARRARFGKSYDDLLTRLRLKQAFGRLIRGPEDKGCFVILEGATPSRLLAAFPEAAPVKRCGLAEAIGDIRAFLGVTRDPRVQRLITKG
jgi:ATP-dependent DNA helicase DinG